MSSGRSEKAEIWMWPGGSLVGPEAIPVSAMEWKPESSSMVRLAMASTKGCTFN